MIMIFVRSVGGSTIRNVTIKVTDKEDLLFMQGLESLGMKRTLACVITFLKDRKERSARSFIRNSRSFAVSLKATEFFRIGAYLTCLGGSPLPNYHINSQ